MAIPQNTNVSMEDVEETKGKNALPDEFGSAEANRIYGGKLSQRILVDIKHISCKDGTNKRKTDKQRLL